MSINNQNIFVVGTARSGTTYLARALALPTEIAYWEESGLVSLYGARRFPFQFAHWKPKDYPGKFKLSNYYMGYMDRIRRINRLKICLRDLLLNAKAGPFDLNPSRLLVEVQDIRLDESDYRQMKDMLGKYRADDDVTQLCRILDDFRRLSGKHICIEKTPSHLNYIPQIQALFPESKIVCIVRNERDSLASYIKNFKPRTSLFKKLRPENIRLRNFAQRCRRERLIKQWVMRQPNCYVVNYEDFTENPYQEVKKIYEWAQVNIDLSPYQHMYKARITAPNWDKLSPRQQILAERFLSQI